MRDRFLRRLILFAVLAAVSSLALAATGAARPGAPTGSGTITADGSSTVAPYVTAGAERFQRANRGAQVTVGIYGIGGCFER